MVRFVTTVYTHMYENSYVGRPEEKYRRKSPNELTDVGVRVERWRKEANLKVAELIDLANEKLKYEQSIDAGLYWAFVRGQMRITDSQIRVIAKVLGVSVHVMTHYSPGHVPDDDRLRVPKQQPTIKVNESAKRAERRRKAQGSPKPKKTLVAKSYDADEAAKLLAKKFGDKVKRNK